MMGQFVAFRSAKGRSIAERKTTVFQIAQLPSWMAEMKNACATGLPGNSQAWQLFNRSRDLMISQTAGKLLESAVRRSDVSPNYSWPGNGIRENSVRRCEFGRKFHNFRYDTVRQPDPIIGYE
jgi:hypothetical protein